jgi:hypothetical protein
VFEIFPAVASKTLLPWLEEMLNKMSFKLPITFASGIENEPSVQPDNIFRPQERMLPLEISCQVVINPITEVFTKLDSTDRV